MKFIILALLFSCSSKPKEEVDYYNEFLEEDLKTLNLDSLKDQ
jgi:hypothetical protein